MAEIRSSTEIAGKWARVTPQRTTDYRDGIQRPRRDWADAASEANDTYVQAVTQAANEGRFSAGVRNAGTQRWQQAASQKGPNRFAEGVQLGENNYQRGFEPFRQTIEGTQLPPRFPRGDPRNIERVSTLARALNERRRQNQGA